jgi:hypothetical protein
MGTGRLLRPGLLLAWDSCSALGTLGQWRWEEAVMVAEMGDLFRVDVLGVGVRGGMA